jgi:hypothetical protein
MSPPTKDEVGDHEPSGGAATAAPRLRVADAIGRA